MAIQSNIQFRHKRKKKPIGSFGPRHLNLMAAYQDELVEGPGGGGGGGGGGYYIPPVETEATPTPPDPPSSGNDSSCPYPGSASMTELSNTVSGGVRTHVFRVDQPVNPGFVYTLGVYAHSVSVTAMAGEGANGVMMRLIDAVNATPLSAWSQYGSNNHNFKPAAVYSLTLKAISVTCDYQHQFGGWANGYCSAPAPTPPPPDPVVTPPPVVEPEPVVTPPPPPPPDPVVEQPPVQTTPPPVEPEPEAQPPYTTAQVNGWDCPTLAGKIMEVSNTMNTTPFTAQTQAAWSSLLNYMQSRYDSVCTVPQQPNNQNPPPVEQTPSVPNYTTAQMNAWDCATIALKLHELQTFMESTTTSADDYQLLETQYNYLQGLNATKCQIAVTPPPDPSADHPVSSVTPPILIPYPAPMGLVSGGSGGSGGAESATPEASLARRKKLINNKVLLSAVAAGTAVAMLLLGGGGDGE